MVCTTHNMKKGFNIVPKSNAGISIIVMPFKNYDNWWRLLFIKTSCSKLEFINSIFKCASLKNLICVHTMLVYTCLSDVYQNKIFFFLKKQKITWQCLYFFLQGGLQYSDYLCRQYFVFGSLWDNAQWRPEAGGGKGQWVTL